MIKRTNRWARAGGVLLVSLALLPGARAYTEPFYGWLQVAGDMYSPGGGSTIIDAGARTVSGIAGRFWCPVADPNCGIAIGPGGAGGAGVASVDPYGGTIRALAGAFNYPGEERVHWTVNLGYGPFEYYPTYWKAGSAATYMRNVWQITSDTLLAGTPVTLDAVLHLNGDMEGGPDAGYSVAMLVNRRADAEQWLRGIESISLGTALDILSLYPTAGRTDGGHPSAVEPDLAVDSLLSWSQTFAVGDEIVVETMLNTFAGAANVGGSPGLFYVWSDFDDTLQSAISVATAGATLVPVPEARTWVMLLAGLGLMTLMGWPARRAGRLALTPAGGRT